jgi:type I restriction enzyme, S subunit
MKKALITQHAPLANDRVKDFVGERRYFATGSVSDNGSFTPELVTYASRPSRADLAVRRGDVCFARMQGTKKIFEVNPTIEDAILSTGFAVLRPNPEILDAKFLQSWINTEAFQSAKDRLCSGATQKAITNAKIKTLHIPLPPLAEQKRIAAILDAADALRTKRRESLDQLDTLLQSTFLVMFGDPVTNPMEWRIERLTDVCVKITDGTHHSPPTLDDGIPYITAKHLKKDGLKFFEKPWYVSSEHHAEIFARCDPQQGDVLYIKDGATTGIAAVNHYDFEFSMLSSLALLKPNTHVIHSVYLCAYLNNERNKSALTDRMGGAAIKRLTLTKIKTFEIPLPPLSLQHRFAAIVESIEQQKATQRQHLEELDTLFAALQQRAFNGELTT